MVSITSASHAPHHLQLLREWFVAEWEHIDPFEGVDPDLPVPAPLLATDGPALLGGLAFTSAPRPRSTETGIWINALLVMPEYRGMGIGSQLIRAAEIKAARNDLVELFVYTSIPELYQKLGWRIVESKGESKVLAIHCGQSRAFQS